jgi:hypothetical protein
MDASRQDGTRGVLAARVVLVAAALAACALGWTRADAGQAGPPARPAPRRLADTGLYADLATRRLAAGVRTWTPQYPLWSDGATKRRFILLPPGKAIDATEPDAWIFPVGTRLWKEFSFGRRVETRYMERRPDGSWIFATYLWSEDGADADLAPEEGVRGAAAIRPGVFHDLLSVGDCTACHGAGPTPVLGFSALQLSPDRDPLAPHREAASPGDVDLPGAVRDELVSDLPPRLLASPPRVRAATPAARAAQGYLHGNCSSCHDGRGEMASLGLDLTQRVDPAPGTGPTATAVGAPSRYRPPGERSALQRIAPGQPDRSALVYRISTRNPAAQMPPIGTHLVDEEAVRLVRTWIEEIDPSRSAGPGRIARSGPPTPTKRGTP